jgi:acyl-CoA hydrolase
VTFADLRERMQLLDGNAEHADRLGRSGHVRDAERKATWVALHPGDEMLERRAVGELAQQVLVVLRVVVELAFVRRRMRQPQARHRVGLVQRQGNREERIVVGDLVALVMHADGHAHADRAEIAMALAHPARDGAGDDREHGIVERRSVELLCGIVQRRQRDSGEGDLTAGANPPVKWRAALPARVLAPQETGEVRAAPSLVRGVGGVNLRLRHVCLSALVPQQRTRVANRRGAVRERVMDSPDQRRAAVLQRDDVDSPQRSRAVEALLEQLGDERQQAMPVDGPGCGCDDDMLGDVEALVGDPTWLARAAGEPPREGWREPDPLGHVLTQAPYVKRQIARRELHDLARVPGNRLALELEDRAILRAERDLLVVHRTTILAYAAAAAKPNRHVDEMSSQPIHDAIAARKRTPEAVLEWIEPGMDVIVGLANAEPVHTIDALEAAAAADGLRDVRLHQMMPMRPRRYIEGELPGLRHVGWFLSPHSRAAFRRGDCDLVPNSFSDVPRLMRQTLSPRLVLSAVSPPDRHGYFSLGPHAEYTAAFIGEVPFFVEVNSSVPRTFGGNQLHISDIVGWCEADTPLVEVAPPSGSERDHQIASLVAERIADGATLQVGIGAAPDLVLGMLKDHHELGVHTELFGDGFVDLVECGALTGTRKLTHRNKIVTTSALGSKRLYDFVDENPGVEFHPVDYTNDPTVIAREPYMTAINATLEVDFLGQCASESLGSEYMSSSGGQPDYARGAVMAEHGQAFIVLHSSTADDTVSRIVPQLHPGAAVTTFKNIVDKVVTEYGVAELRGSSIAERTRRLIAVAHPSFREELSARARELCYLM